MGKKMMVIFSIFWGLILMGSQAAAWPVPDTGQTGCYDAAGTSITCPEPGQPFAGQDGNYSINPPSYTKLDESGNALPDSATSWVMVRDDVTGLIWEKKTDKDGIVDNGNYHDANNKYTWYDPNPETNGGIPGRPGNGTDTKDFIDALNEANFGGYSDWRMPTRKELRSIAIYGWRNPAININYFPNTQSSYYWSSTTCADQRGDVWGVYQGSGLVNSLDKSGNMYIYPTYYVRAVRGGQ